MLSIGEARSRNDLAQVRGLFQEYAASLGLDLCFQGFEHELANLPGGYAPPDGRLLLASWNNAVAGCVALRRLDTDICEMKRLYVRPAFRALGVGRELAQQAIRDARAAGYKSIRLDSLPSMAAAITLYRRLDFHEIPPYCDNPVHGAVFLELPLNGQHRDS